MALLMRTLGCHVSCSEYKEQAWCFINETINTVNGDSVQVTGYRQQLEKHKIQMLYNDRKYIVCERENLLFNTVQWQWFDPWGPEVSEYFKNLHQAVIQISVLN